MNIKKRGDLSIEELVKLVLGALVLIAIIVLLVQLVKIAHSNVQAEQAKNTLDRLVYEIQKLKDGEKKEFLIEGPKDYVIWINSATVEREGGGYDDFGSLCVCPSDYLVRVSNQRNFGSTKEAAFYNLCYNSGFCSKSLKVVMEYPSMCDVFKATVFNIDRAEIKNCIYLNSVPVGLSIKKRSGVANIYLKESTDSSKDGSVNDDLIGGYKPEQLIGHVPSFFVEKVNSLNVGNIESFDLIIPRDWVSPQRPIFVFVGGGVDYNTLCACEKPLLDSGGSGFGCEYKDAEGHEYYQSCSPLTTDAKIVFGSGSEDCNIKYRVLDKNYRWVEGVMNFNCLKIDSSRKTLEMVNDGVSITISSILDV